MDHGENHTESTTTAPVSIIIPAFNQLEYCQQCIASLRRATPEPHRLILVDNGSTDGVGAYFDTIENAIVVHAEENLGFAAGVNLGLQQAQGHVVLLNSDTLLSPHWLSRLTHALLREKNIGMVGPVSNCAVGPQQLEELSLNALDEIDAFAEERAQEKRGEYRDVTRLIGFCLMIRDTTLEKVGLFDERFGIGNFEDDDYCTRVRQAGYRLVLAEDTFVFHYGGRTFSGMGLEGDAFDHLMQENRQRYMDKWEVHLPTPSTPAEKGEKLCKQAQQRLAEGKTQEALALLQKAIRTAPQYLPAYLELSALLVQAGQTKLAYQLCLEAIKHDPYHEKACQRAEKLAQDLHKTDAFQEFLTSLRK